MDYIQRWIVVLSSSVSYAKFGLFTYSACRNKYVSPLNFQRNSETSLRGLEVSARGVKRRSSANASEEKERSARAKPAEDELLRVDTQIHFEASTVSSFLLPIITFTISTYTIMLFRLSLLTLSLMTAAAATSFTGEVVEQEAATLHFLAPHPLEGLEADAETAAAMLGHYGKPPDACEPDEKAFQISGVPGMVSS
jgi:hypothetical protein